MGKIFEISKRLNIDKIKTKETEIISVLLFDRIIGLNSMNRYDLRVRSEGYSNHYDPTCNPSTFNEFGTAAFR
jgi:hypothetical protein